MAVGFIDFAELKSKVSIHMVMQMLGLQLTQRGDQYRGTCPIHKGTNPREFVITASKGLWYCFGGCGGGDGIELVAKIRGVKPHEAAHVIAEHYGTVHDSASRTAKTDHKTAQAHLPQIPAEQRSGFDPVAYAAKLDPLHASLVPLGVSPVTLTEFRAGYASSGLLRGRLALPVHDLRGNMLWFCGRSLDNSEPRLVFPKNVDPHSVVFNGHAVYDTDFAYLCTDPLEVMKARQNGIDNVVAALGSINPEFLQVLSLWMEEQRIAAIEPM